MNGNIFVSDLDFGHIRQTQIEEEVVGRGCHVEQLRLPQITSSDAFLKHEMRLVEVSNLLSEYGTSLRSAPISIQFNSYHSEIDSAGLIHSYSPFVCNLNSFHFWSFPKSSLFVFSEDSRCAFQSLYFLAIPKS